MLFSTKKKILRYWDRFIIGVFVIGFLLSFCYTIAVYKYGLASVYASAMPLLRNVLIMIVQIIALITLAGIGAVLQSLFARSKVHVFLGYQHDHESRTAQVAQALRAQQLKVNYVPFQPREHDEVIAKVLDEIRQADVLVFLPGKEASFADSEIFAASYARKPIIMLKTLDGQMITNTSLRGYPVLEFAKLEEKDFLPLGRFIHFVARSRKDTLRNYFRTNKAFMHVQRRVFVFVFFSLYFMQGFAALVGIFWGIASWMKLYAVFYQGVTMLVGSTLIWAYVSVYFKRRKANRITRQLILTRENTLAQMAKTFSVLRGDRDMLACFNKIPLAIRHDNIAEAKFSS